MLGFTVDNKFNESMSELPLKLLKINGVFTGSSVVMADLVNITNFTTTYLPMIGHLFDTIIITSTDAIYNSPLAKRVVAWGKGRRALSCGIVYCVRTKL